MTELAEAIGAVKDSLASEDAEVDAAIAYFEAQRRIRALAAVRHDRDAERHVRFIDLAIVALRRNAA